MVKESKPLTDERIKKLAQDLEVPRAIQLLAEWLAINNGETRLQSVSYLKDAEELHVYLAIVGYRLPPKLELIGDAEKKACWAYYKDGNDTGVDEIIDKVAQKQLAADQKAQGVKDE